ncbi:hypothetical protein V6N13_094863 [Hibiscus sabdariffa]|uniref:FIP-RBD domain-containing protein n=1 Tax=Hibiscus sabdariffa TaxID=183260 RepID=A0ABR2PTC1_9ROSI
MTSDHGSDTAYETSELGTPRLGRDDSSEIGSGDLTLDEDLTGSIEKLVKYDAQVKDLEVELENSKQKSNDTLQQAILLERERFTQMQWEMEDLRRKSLEMELKLNPKWDEKQITETTNHSATEEKDAMLQELNATKEQLNDISKRYEELEAKSKADIKVLVKEVKSLRKSQKELKQEVGQSLSEKSEAEAQLEQERQIIKHVRNAREELLNECQLLHNRLRECSVNLSTNDENLIKDSSSVEEALDLLTTDDDKITLLLAEVQLLAKEEGNAFRDINIQYANQYDARTDDELRKIIADIFAENARLRKQVNSHLRHRLEPDIM